MGKARTLIATLFILFIASLFVFPSSVQASVFSDFINSVKGTVQDGVDNVKNLLGKNTLGKNISIESKIELASGGDLNKNGEIDAGDIITFSYMITNPTKNVYKAATLKTNTNIKDVSGITNVRGALNLDSSKDTLSIPYLTINPGQVLVMSFDAQINFYKDADHQISTEAELVDGNSVSLVKTQKEEVTAKKMDMERFSNVTHSTK